MRLAVLSDVHGNLPALEAVLSDLAARGGADEYLMLGDYAAMGAWPGACVARMRALPNCRHIRGNSDRYLFPDLRSPLTAETEAARADEAAGRERMFGWSRDRIDPADHRFLRDAPLAHSLRLGQTSVLAVHASPASDEIGVAASTSDDDVARVLGPTRESVVLLGHTHTQFDRVEPATGRRVINPGSIGMPLDGDRRAGYAVVTADAASFTVELRRVEYDVDAAIAALHERAFPAAAMAESRLRHARSTV